MHELYRVRTDRSGEMVGGKPRNQMRDGRIISAPVSISYLVLYQIADCRSLARWGTSLIMTDRSRALPLARRIAQPAAGCRG